MPLESVLGIIVALQEVLLLVELLELYLYIAVVADHNYRIARNFC